jgi:hypothetical protein
MALCSVDWRTKTPVLPTPEPAVTTQRVASQQRATVNGREAQPLLGPEAIDSGQTSALARFFLTRRRIGRGSPDARSYRLSVIYTSPFTRMDDDHSSTDPLCLSRSHHQDADTATWYECHEAALALCEIDAPQFAFWATRQLVELGLKRLIGAGYSRTHDLVALAERALPTSDANEASTRLRDFAADLHRIDPIGDQGRYPEDTRGNPSLNVVCCVERDALIALIDEVFAFVESRTLVVS